MLHFMNRITLAADTVMCTLVQVKYFVKWTFFGFFGARNAFAGFSIWASLRSPEPALFTYFQFHQVGGRFLKPLFFIQNIKHRKHQWGRCCSSCEIWSSFTVGITNPYSNNVFFVETN